MCSTMPCGQTPYAAEEEKPEPHAAVPNLKVALFMSPTTEPVQVTGKQADP